MPPLAAVDTTVGSLPARITLNNGSAVGPFNLSSAESVYVSALVSFGGVATPRTGDYRVVSEPFALNDETTAVDLVISAPVP